MNISDKELRALQDFVTAFDKWIDAPEWLGLEFEAMGRCREAVHRAREIAQTARVPLVRCPVCGSSNVSWRTSDLAVEDSADHRASLPAGCDEPECGAEWLVWLDVSGYTLTDDGTATENEEGASTSTGEEHSRRDNTVSTAQGEQESRKGGGHRG